MALPSSMDNKENYLIITDLSDDEEYSQESLKNLSAVQEAASQNISLPCYRVSSGTPITRLTYSCPPSIERDTKLQNNSYDASELPSISEHILEDPVISTYSAKESKQNDHFPARSPGNKSSSSQEDKSLYDESAHKSNSEKAASRLSQDETDLGNVSKDEFFIKSQSEISLEYDKERTASKEISLSPDDELRLSHESSINIPLDFSNSIASSRRDSNSEKRSLSSRKSSKRHTVNESKENSLDLKYSLEDPKFTDSLASVTPAESAKDSMESDEVIMLDIRGQASQKNFSFENPLYDQTRSKKDPITAMKTDEDLVNISRGNKMRIPSPVIVRNPVSIRLPLHDDSITDELKIEDVTDKKLNFEENVIVEYCASEGDQRDCLMEEIVINNSIDEGKDDTRMIKSPPPSNDNDLNVSLSTMTTEYRTFGDDVNNRPPDIQAALLDRDAFIEKLTVSLQESIVNRELLQLQNHHLVSQLGDMQQRLSEATSETCDLTKGHLSDFIKHEIMLREDHSSLQSSVRESALSGVDDMEMLRAEHRVEVDLLNSRHRQEVEDLRTYFERKCHDMEKQYSEEVFSQQSARRSSSSSGDSLDRCPENLPFGSPLHVATGSVTGGAGGDHARKRSRSVDYHTRSIQQSDELEKQKQAIRDTFDLKCLEIRSEHGALIANLQEEHRKQLEALKVAHSETVGELKAHIQTLQNTEVNVTILNEDIDLELERSKSLEDHLQEVRLDVVHQLQEQIQALLGDPSADLSGSGCPVELSLLRDRIQFDTHAHYQRQIEQIRKEHELELSSVRTAHDSSNHCEGLSQKEKWRQKRNDSFDKNRRLEEVTKERDGLAQLSRGLQRVLRQLVGYFSACEDEVNNTLLEELLKQHLDFTSSSDSTLDQEPQSSNTSLVEPTQSSKRPSVGKRVHFAPDVDSIISQFNPESVLDNIEKQADVSIEIKNELDICLNRLRQEAQDLLTISSKVGNERPIGKPRLSDAYGAGDFETQKPESDTVVLKEEIESFKNRICKLDCDKKELEEAIKEGLHRESLLRDELKLTLSRVAEYANDGEELPKSGEVITEGYGICPTARPGRPPRTPRLVQSPQTPQTPRTPRSDSRHHSLDSVVHGQYYAARTQDLNAELDAVTKEKDDFAKQLEAANRFLLSNRKFLEDQTTEWESERDQYLKGLNQLKEENARLNVKLQSNDIINAEMAQIETQVREKNTFIADLENRKAEVEANLKTAMEKVTVLREIICNLEAQLEEKGDRETNLIEDLEQLRLMSDAKDCRIRDLQDEYDTLKLEMYRKTAIAADKDESSGESESTDQKLITTIRTQLESLEATVMKRTSALERLYDRCPHSNSEPSEDLSLADHRQRSSVSDEAKMDQAPEVLRADIPVPSSPRRLLYRLSEGLARHYRAEEAALKRIRDLEMQLSQLRDVAQEVRLERDALQQRLSEQALRVSSLQARLDAQRHAADVLRRDVQDKAAIQLNDANAELQATKEALEKREKQLARWKNGVGDGSLKNSQDTADVDSVEEDRPSLQRQLAEEKAKNEELKANLESANAGERTDDELMLLLLAEKNADIELLKEHLAEKEQLLFHREQQLNELMALKLDEDQPREESENEVNKNSARTLSDIISLSEYDQSDLQIRKAEIRYQDTSNIFLQLSGNGKSLNHTLPPKNIEQVEFAKRSPRFDRAVNLTRDSKHGDGVHSLPLLDTTANARVGNKSASLLENYKRNVNETVLFGVSLKTDKHSTGHQVDNSLLPNQDASQKKQVLIEPKRINFSVPSTHDDLIDQSPKLTLDYEQKVFPDVLTQLKHEIRRLSAELEEKKAALDAAQVQLLLFNAVQTELEEVRGLLQDSVKTVEADKKFYNDQIENFSAVEKDLKKRLEYAIIQANEKASDLQLLKQDILKRENMVLELAKEKRIVQQRLDEMELKLEVLQNKADLYESACTENERMRAKLQDHQNKDDIISEKNIQIDSLNEHLDRLDNFQRELEEKDEQLKTLRTELQDKSNEIEQLNENVANLTNKEVNLSTENKSLKENMSKLEKEQENIAMKEQAIEKREKDIEKTLELNAELASKIEEMKELNERLKDKEYEVDLLNEDIAAFHEEIASLKDQLVIQTPSPRDGSSSNSDTTKKKSGAESDRQATNDKKELRKITKKVGLLQNELGLNKKELNIKAFELERAKLEVMELRNELEIMRNFVLDKDREIRDMAIESNALKDQLQAIADKIREDGNLDDLRQKLQSKCDECLALEREVELLKEVMDRMRSQSPADNRLAILAPGDVSALARPTMTRASRRLSINEIEERLKHELDTSQKLDDSLLEQILVGREKEDDSALRFEGAKRSLPITAEQLIKLTSDNEHLKKQASVLEERIRDKDVLIQELNSIREGLMRDLQIAEARFEDERDNGERIQLLLDSERNTSKNLQDHDANMIQVLKSRLESALDSKSELETSFKEEQDIRKNLDKQLKSKRDRHTGGDELIRNLEERLEDEMEKSERLLSEVQLLRAKRSTDKERLVDLQHILDREKSTFQLEGEKSSTALNVVRAQVVEMRRKERSLQSELNHTKTQLQLRAAEVDSLHDRMNRIKSHSGRSLDYATSELADQNSKLNKQKLDLINEVHLLKEKLSTLRQSRKENPVYSSTTVLNIHDDADTENQVRHLYRCYIRVESFRKALVHQKKFLLSGLGSMALLNLQLKPNKRKSFRSVVFGILAISRLRYLVRRWHSGRKLGDCLFSRATVYPSQKKPQHSRTSNQQHSSKPYQVSSSPPCRERSSTRRSASREASQANLLGGNSGQGSPLQAHSDSTCVYRDVLGVYANPELFSGTITINERKRFESRAKEDDNSQLHTPSVNLDPNATLNRYLQRLDETTKLVKRALDTPRSTH